jgi:hypothetical protein
MKKHLIHSEPVHNDHPSTIRVRYEEPPQSVYRPEPFERAGEPSVWSIEQIGQDGEIYQAIFCGPDAETRCREYARLKGWT